MIYFTSDTHFGHTNIAGAAVSNWDSGYRTFNSVEKMDKEIINRINEYVKQDDELWHLGDWSFKGNPRTYFDRLVCKNIHLILGNHDRERNLKGVPFLSVQRAAEINISKIKFCLSHYAHRVWNKSHRGSIHLYGHSHSSIADDWGKSMDVGVDNIAKLFGEYRPISEVEVLEIMAKRDMKVVDHHELRD